jgi:hypothetical protein
MADGAYWFDNNSGNFVSSSYYFASGELPAWVSELNRSRPGDKYAGREWLGHKAPAEGKALYSDVEATPWGNELIHLAAVKALAAEKLGMGPKIDLLAVSYSSNDYVGHRYGPDSPEAHDMALRVDVLIGELIAAAEKQAGLGRVLVVMSADHGVAPVPEVSAARKMPGGRTNAAQARAAVEKALTARFGEGKYFADAGGESYTVAANPVAGKSIDRSELEHVAAEVLRVQPHVFRVYTRSQLLAGAISSDIVGLSVRNGFNEVRSPDIIVIPEPFYQGGTAGTTHGTPFSYDTHVPVMFLGPGVKAGKYNRRVPVNDIAPTLATILEIETPSGSVGQALTEMLP